MRFIEVTELGKQYGTVKALDQVSFSMERGEWVAMMGPSGSGKTTLLNMIGCLDTPTSGSIHFAGTDVTKLSQETRTTFRREKIGLIFQQFYLIPYLTALENVMLAQYFHSMTDREEAKQALIHVGLGDRLNHRPRELSGGEQQRVCIARALINQPQLILADEPTGNLDEKNEERVMALLKNLHRQGHSILMVTHDPTVARFTDRKIELHHGRIVHSHRHEDFDQMPTDEILEAIWLIEEQDGKAATLPKLSLLTEENYPSAIPRMIQDELITQEGDTLHYTEKGKQRAAGIIRRHRLAEILLTRLFELEEEQIETTACKLEHILSEEVTESVCKFLGHPGNCPHDKPIPNGNCCAGTRGTSDSLSHPVHSPYEQLSRKEVP